MTFSLKHAGSNFEVDINTCISVPFLTSFSYFSPNQIACDFPQISCSNGLYVELRNGVSESISSLLLGASSSANDYFSSTQRPKNLYLNDAAGCAISKPTYSTPVCHITLYDSNDLNPLKTPTAFPVPCHIQQEIFFPQMVIFVRTLMTVTNT